MRLIIVDDSYLALKGIIELILEEDILHSDQIVCIKCGSNEEGKFQEKGVAIENANNYEDIIQVLEDKLKLNDTDRIFFDVGIFGEKEEEMRFTDFGSVKCADYIKRNYPKVKCKFYTVIYGATRLDFARETNYNWGEPVLRPVFTVTAKEKDKKTKLINEIKKLVGGIE